MKIKIYTKEWSDWKILVVDEDVYQVNDWKEVVFYLADILGQDIDISELSHEDFMEKING